MDPLPGCRSRASPKKCWRRRCRKDIRPCFLLTAKPSSFWRQTIFWCMHCEKSVGTPEYEWSTTHFKMYPCISHIHSFQIYPVIEAHHHIWAYRHTYIISFFFIFDHFFFEQPFIIIVRCEYNVGHYCKMLLSWQLSKLRTWWRKVWWLLV